MDKKRSPKKIIIISLLAVLSALYAITTWTSIHFHEAELNDILAKDEEMISHFYYSYEEYEADEMLALINVIKENTIFKEALKKGDRLEINRAGDKVFADLKARSNITHFYFTGTDRVNITRLHNMPRYGDLINRTTTMKAEASGKDSWGFELGPFGTFTLRVVSPVYENGVLLGYIELGKDIEHFSAKLTRFLGVPAYVFIHKKYIQRGGWEDGLEMLGRKGVWDRYLDSVLVGERPSDISDDIIEYMADAESRNDLVEIDGKTCQVRSLPLLDVNNRETGHMAILLDVTDAQADLYRYILIHTLIFIVAGILLLTLTHLSFARHETR